MASCCIVFSRFISITFSVFFIVFVSISIHFIRNYKIKNFKELAIQWIVRFGRITRKMGFQELEVNHVTLDYENLPDDLNGTTFVQLSDFHFDLYESDSLNHKLLEDAINVANEINPDFVFLTGDFVSWNVNAAPEIARRLGRIKSKKFGCFGTHDMLSGHNKKETFKKMVYYLKKYGDITILHNDFLDVSVHLTVLAFGDPLDGSYHPKRVLGKLDKDKFKVALSHNSDTIKFLFEDEKSTDIQLLLSAHTHGGQIQVPFLNIPIAQYFRGFLGMENVVTYWKYFQGLFNFNERYAYVNRGLAAHMNMRLFCKPELTVFTLQKRRME